MVESLLYMVDNLTNENIMLRREGTRLKLVMLQIIEDLEKEDNAILKQALTRLVEAFNGHISDKSPVRDLIK